MPEAEINSEDDQPIRGDAPERLAVEEWHNEPDPELRFLVAVANKVELEVSVRIFFAGGLLSGQIIGMGTYLERLAESLKQVTQDDSSQEIRGVLADTYAQGADHVRSDERERDGFDTDVRHVHLDGAWLHSPGADPLWVGLWRGRLAQVSGWSMGGYENPPGLGN